MILKKNFDVIIVGGSYAGLAAGMALGRALRNVLIIDAGNPCNKQTAHNTTRMRTVANSVSMGTTTGLMVNKVLIEEDF